MRTIRRTRRAASTVRMAATASELKPAFMASFPKTGLSPRKTAELSAAKMPPVSCPRLIRCWSQSSEYTLLDQRFDFLQELVVEEVTFLHQGLNLAAKPFLLVRRQLLRGRNNDRDVRRLLVGLQLVHHCKAVHLGHHQVEDDQ